MLKKFLKIFHTVTRNSFAFKIYLSPMLHRLNLKPKLDRQPNYFITVLW